MKLNEKVILKRIKANLNKCMALLLVLIYVLSMVPLTANASNEEPQLGANDNIAEYMTVTNNDVDCTADYRNTKEINVISNTRGSFGNIKHTDMFIIIPPIFVLRMIRLPMVLSV